MRSLQRLLRVKEIGERRARARLAEAHEERSRADGALAEAAHAHADNLAVPRPPGNAADLSSARAAHLATFEAVVRTDSLRLGAERRVEAATGTWIRSVSERDSVDELETRRRQALAYEASRSAERTLDELMAMRWRPR